VVAATEGPPPDPVPAEVRRAATRNISLLSATQAIVGSNQAVVMAVGALTGAILAPDPALATVPTSAMVIGLALTAGPATFTIHRLGRRNGFIVGASLAIIGGLAASYAVFLGSFVGFCIALAFLGGSAAFGQQYRFAAADSVPQALKARAISFVLLGGVLAGFLGPRLAYVARNWIEGHEYAGSFIITAILATIAIAILMFTRLAPTAAHDPEGPVGRSWGELLKDPDIVVPMISGMASYALMTFVMVAAPLAMVHVCGHPVESATNAIQWHIVAMFAPSFVTGSLIKRFGPHIVTGLGLFLILICAVIALSGITEWHFYAALVLLGVGWNFGFIGSTSLLTMSYRPEEAARAQGLNEQLVFGTMAIASIGSGALLQWVGWESINVLVIPIATFAMALLGWSDLRRRRKPA